jgi:hypothetical protein
MLKNSIKYMVLGFGLLALVPLFAASIDIKKLARQLQTDPAHVFIIPLNPKVFLVKQNFPADGQFHYYLLQDNNQLTPVSHWLPKVNKNNLIIYAKPPEQKHLAHGAVALLFEIDSRPCVACATSHRYQLRLVVNAEGRLLSSVHTLPKESVNAVGQ